MSEPDPNDATARERQAMADAIALAEKARGQTRPNPLVGAIVLARGAGALPGDAGTANELGRGFHQRASEPHAETIAINASRDAFTGKGKGGVDALRGSTLVVTLEPCNHHGRTPPCTQAILDAGIARVVFGAADPSRDAAGGAVRLREAGVTVVGPTATREVRAQNRGFFSGIERGRPWTIAKWAMTADGKIATVTGESQWISNRASRERAHRLRGEADAVIVGSGTVASDNPRLTYRGSDGLPQPLRVVLDGDALTDANARLFRSSSDDEPDPPGDSIVVTRADAPADRQRALTDAGAVLWHADSRPGGGVSVRGALEQLTTEHAAQIALIEGGGTLLAGAFAEGVIDEIVLFIAPTVIGGREAPTPVRGAGIARLASALRLTDVTCELIPDPDADRAHGVADICIRAIVQH